MVLERLEVAESLRAQRVLHVSHYLHGLLAQEIDFQEFLSGRSELGRELVGNAYALDPTDPDYVDAIQSKLDDMWNRPEIFTEFARIAMASAVRDEQITNLINRNRYLEQQGERDRLTGLLLKDAWRMRLDQAIDRARATGEPFAVAIFDLDGFKLANAIIGARKADDKLKATARVLLEQTREGKQSAAIAIMAVGRMGGDEFAMLLTEFTTDKSEVTTGKESSSPYVTKAEGVPLQRRTEHYASFAAKVETAVRRIERDISDAIADEEVPRLKATGDYVVWEPGMSAEDLLDLVDKKAHQRKFDQIQEMFKYMTSEELEEYRAHAIYLREKLKVDYRVIPLPGERIDI